MSHDTIASRFASAVIALCVVGGSLVLLGATDASASTVSRTDAAGTVWLCRPGIADNPCTGSLDATSVTAGGKQTVQNTKASGSHRFGCFYIYPTASNEKSINSDLTVQPAETQIAYDQAARFSQVCNVWAPMYRQVTVSALSGAGASSGGENPSTVAFDSVVSAWKDYITHYNDGRPIIFISHSQGSVEMIQLLSKYVDNNKALRNRTVAAIIAGGNVTVPTGKTVGGTFQHLALCTSDHDSHCVIAYSSFPDQPPANSQYGRPGQGISLNSGQTATTGLQVACTNPADLKGGSADLSSYFLVNSPQPLSDMAPTPSVATPWVTYPGEFSGECMNAEGATWLQITKTGGATDARPVPNEQPFGASWGYHFEDINLVLGSLVSDVRSMEASYRP